MLRRCYTTNMFEVIQDWLNTNLFPIVLILVAAWAISSFGVVPIKGFIRRTVTYRTHGDKTEQDIRRRQNTLISICTAIFRVVVWTTATFEVVKRFGVDPTPILAGAGVAGFAIAFGAQSLIKDFVSGLFIVLENQYRVGDTATLGTATGTIEKITIRTTVLRDEEGSVHYIPNGTITHSINKTMGYSKLNLSFFVDPKTDVDKLADIINKVGEKMYHDEKWSKKLLERPRFLNIGKFSETSVEVKITGKVPPTSKWNVSNELEKRVLAAFDKNQVKIVADAADKNKKPKE